MPRAQGKNEAHADFIFKVCSYTIGGFFLSFLLALAIMMTVGTSNLLFSAAMLILIFFVIAMFAFPAIFIYSKFKFENKKRFKDIVLAVLTGIVAAFAYDFIRQLNNPTLEVPQKSELFPQILQILIGLVIKLLSFLLFVSILIVPVWYVLKFLEEKEKKRH